MSEAPIGTEELVDLFDDDRGDVIAVSSSDGVILYVSPACVGMTGWVPSDLVGHDGGDFVHPEDLDGVVAVRRAVAASATALVSTFRFRCADGRYVWTEAVIKRVIHPRQPGTFVVMECIRNIADRKLVEARLERQASTDPLTGIATRSVLMDRLRQGLRRLERVTSVLGLIYLDLDRFKVINDSLGHDLGDRLLIAVAERAIASLRPADTLARMGGDEFVILVEGLTNVADAVNVAERACAAMQVPFDLDGEAIVCTVSAGVATTTDPNHSAVGLLQEADLALYRAKGRGRNRAEIFDEDLRSTAVGRLATERMIRAALEEGRFVVHYQPIIDLSTGRRVGAEALVRIVRPDDTLVLPGEFLDVAEETGLLVAIDEQVFAAAVAQAKAWTHDADPRALGGVSINVSGRHLADSHFVDLIAGAVTDHGLPAGSLMIEVTERTLMEASRSTMASIGAIRALGVPFGLDDFGTGYSSLAYLRQFPLDFVKIDSSFVSQLDRTSQDIAIVSAIIDLAHALGLTVIAEGVETGKQLDILTRLGCDQAQGFLIAQPADLRSLRGDLRRVG